MRVGGVARGGRWGEMGKAPVQAGEGRRRPGRRPIATGSALTALGTALANDDTWEVVADVDWDRFAPAFTANRPTPLLDGLPAVRLDLLFDEAREPRSQLRSRLVAVLLGEPGVPADVGDEKRPDATCLVAHETPGYDAARPSSKGSVDGLCDCL